jgi:hypothetical protein
MKWVYLTLIALLGSTSSWSQAITTKTIKGNVTFDQDPTDWVAAVMQKDTVSVLFKMMFEQPLKQPLPPNGYYEINYGADLIQFTRINKPETYSFYTNHLAVTEPKKGERRWPIIGLARMNPVCFPPRK